MNTKPINLAIIGCGAVIEELHLPSLRRLVRQNAISVSSLIDCSEERTARLQRYFPNARCFQDAEEAFSASEANAALVASPPGLHRSHVETALSHGCNVLCEKPLAGSSADIERMIDAVQEHSKLLMVGMTRRFFPSLRTAASLLQDGFLGEHVEFRCLEGSVYQWPIASDAPFRREVGGGGVLMDKGVHVLDSLLWLFGPMNILSFQDDALAGGVEGNCIVKLGGKDASGTMQLSWDQSIANFLWAKGTLGEMKVDPNEFRWVEFRRHNQPWVRRPCHSQWPMTLDPEKPKQGGPITYEDCIYMEWIQFLRSSLFAEPVPVDASAALAVTQQIESAFSNAAPLAQPWLPAREQEAAVENHWNNRI